MEDLKKILGGAVNALRTIKIPEEKITDLAYLTGNMLADKIDPGNKEQKLLNDLRLEADKEEWKILARLVVLVSNKTPRE